MSIGPMNEVLCSITNILRKSTEGKMFFEFTEEGEERFDKWQNLLFKSAQIIHDSWNDESDICEQALKTFERSFSTPFTIKEETL